MDSADGLGHLRYFMGVAEEPQPLAGSVIGASSTRAVQQIRI
jgi:hypothetical protein